MANTKITSKVIADANILTAAIADNAVTGDKVADDVALAGNPTTTTQSAGNDTTRIATTAFVSTAISNLVDSSPSALNTLNELAAALGDDANFSTTVTNSIAAKLPLAGGTMTGNIVMGDDTSIGIGDSAERIEFDGAGDISVLGANFGVNSTSPATKFVVQHTDGESGIEFSMGASLNYIQSYDRNASDYVALKFDGEDLRFGTNNGTERMRITSTGFVGIGTTSPDAKLHIEGNSDTSDEDCMIVVEDLDTTAGSKVPAILFKGNGSTIGRMRVNDSLGFMFSGGSTMSDDLVVKNGPLVGVGTNSPSATDWGSASPVVQISGTQPLLSFKDSDVTDGEFQLANSGQNFYIWDAAASATRLFIKSDGLVGIGTASPSTTLHAKGGSASSYIRADNSADGHDTGFEIYQNGNRKWEIYNDDAVSAGSGDALSFRPSGTITYTMSQGGHLSIGTGAQAGHEDQILRVFGDSNGYAMLLSNDRSTVDQPQGLLIDTSAVSSDNNSQVFLKCDDSSAARMQVFTDGDVWTSDAGTLSSDETLKTDIVDATSKLSDVMNLKVRNFKWKSDYHPVKQHKHIGFIAQELETVFPALIVENNIARHDEEPNMKKGIKQGGLIPILVKCIQELSAKNDALETRIKTLEDA